MESSNGLGPRRTGLLQAWEEYAATEQTGPYHNFGPDNRYERVESRLTAFLNSPTQETFESLWNRDVLRDAVMGGPGLVLSQWPGTVEELAARLQEMQAADEYDPSWERDIITKTAVRELYGFMDPSSRPILSSAVTNGLNAFGFSKPASYRERPGYHTFADAYEELVGHATEGTAHEVPWHFELEQFLVMIGSEDRYEILQELPIEKGSQLLGWHAEGQAGRITFTGVDSLLDKYIDTRVNGGFGQAEVDMWGGTYWETWKWTHATHIRETVRTNYEVSDLAAGDVEAFLNQFKNAPSVELSSSVPTYLLGGRSGGILWNEFKTHSAEHPTEAASVLSILFDESQPIRDRMTEFNDFYAALDTSGGPLLSLASVLLMLTYPDTYVMYKYGKFASFFGEYSDFDVATGFDATQYWVLNEACQRLKRTMNEAFTADERISTDASMLDVHTLIWVAVGVEEL